MTHDDIKETWKSTDTATFWDQIAPCDHVLQIYKNDEAFLTALTDFVSTGFQAGDSVILIATPAHLKALEENLRKMDTDLDSLARENRYIALHADETLSRFMIKGWPDETLFKKTISAVIERAGYKKRNIRAFGEMVALLWEKNMTGATVYLEHLWNKFCSENPFTLFCAYPQKAFAHELNSSMQHICKTHSKIISGVNKQPGEILFSEID